MAPGGVIVWNAPVVPMKPRATAKNASAASDLRNSHGLQAIREYPGMTCRLHKVLGADDIAAAGSLFRDYQAAIGVDLCFQGFAAELAHLPGKYAPPEGTLVLARGEGGEALGCVGVRKLDQPGMCEIKRLFVRPAGRGHGLGRALAGEAIRFATDAGYAWIVLDTLPAMTAAIELYRSLGFEPVSAYWANTHPGVLFFGKRLRGEAPPYSSGSVVNNNG